MKVNQLNKFIDPYKELFKKSAKQSRLKVQHKKISSSFRKIKASQSFSSKKSSIKSLFKTPVKSSKNLGERFNSSMPIYPGINISNSEDLDLEPENQSLMSKRNLQHIELAEDIKIKIDQDDSKGWEQKEESVDIKRPSFQLKLDSSQQKESVDLDIGSQPSNSQQKSLSKSKQSGSKQKEISEGGKSESRSRKEIDMEIEQARNQAIMKLKHSRSRKEPFTIEKLNEICTSWHPCSSIVFGLLFLILSGYFIYTNIQQIQLLLSKLSRKYMDLWLYGSLFLPIYGMILHVGFLGIWAVLGKGKRSGILPTSVYEITNYIIRNADKQLIAPKEKDEMNQILKQQLRWRNYSTYSQGFL